MSLISIRDLLAAGIIISSGIGLGGNGSEWIQGNGFRGIDLGKKGKGISAVKIIAMGYLASIFVGNIPRSVARAIGRHASSMTR